MTHRPKHDIYWKRVIFKNLFQLLLHQSQLSLTLKNPASRKPVTAHFNLLVSAIIIVWLIWIWIWIWIRYVLINWVSAVISAAIPYPGNNALPNKLPANPPIKGPPKSTKTETSTEAAATKSTAAKSPPRPKPPPRPNPPPPEIL